MTKELVIDRIATKDAPSPFGHYVQATAFKDLIFVSGQLAADPDGSSNADASFEEQARQAIQNAVAITLAAGGSLDSVLKVTAYIVGVENWPAFNNLFAEAFGDIRPARAVVPVPELHNGYLIEMEIVAVRRIDHIVAEKHTYRRQT